MEESVDSFQVLARGALVAGRYRVVRLLGVGGMGMVYQVHDEQLDLPAALKVLRPERAGSEEMRERFRRELILARQVSHKNVVRIHDLGHDGELMFLTMDFVAGRSLKELLAEEGPLPAERAVAIAGQLAGALEAAHREGVVHRDLKPANVLLGEDDRVYVTDFGIARSLSATGLTASGSVMGTPDYLSPEQARGEKADHRTDVYALGLVFFEMLAGRSPFAGGTITELLAQRIHGRALDLEEAGAVAPEHVRRIVARCLESDPEERYQSAADLAADLVAGRPPTSSQRPPARPPKWTAAGAFRWAFAASLAAALVLLAARTWHRGSAEIREADAARPKHAVAVLSLADETGRDDLGWTSNGVAEMVAAKLAESPGLRVVDALRVIRTLGDLKFRAGPLPDADLRLLAELFDADRLVVGSVRTSGGRIRVDVELIMADEPHLPAERFHAEVGGEEEVFLLIERLAAELARRLGAPLWSGRAGERPEGGVPAASLAGYGRGLEELARGDAAAAAQALELAVRDGGDGFDAAWLRLAAAYERLGYQDRALTAAGKAAALLDAESRLGLLARARQAALADRPGTARELLEEVVGRYPHDVEARLVLGEALGAEGRYEEAMETLAAVTARDPNHPRAWYFLGRYAILRGDSRRAVDDYLTRALVIHNRLGNRGGQGEVLIAFGIAFEKLGDRDQALEHFRQAAEIWRALGDRRGLSGTLVNLAGIQGLLGDFEAARSTLNEALGVRRELGDRVGVATIHNQLGFLEDEQGRYRQALDQYHQGLDLRRELGDQVTVAESLTDVGFVHFLLGEYEQAKASWDSALEFFRESGNREGEVLVLQCVAQLELAQGRWRRAIELSLEVLETSRELGMPVAEAVARGNLGRVAHFQGRYRAALESYAEAREIVTELEVVRGQVEYTLFEAATLLELGLVEEAAERFRRAGEWLEPNGNREQRAELWRLRGEHELLLGRPRAARELLDRARDEAAASGSLGAELWARLGLAQAALAGGDPAAALAAIEPVARQADRLDLAVLRLGAGALRAAAERSAGRLESAEREAREVVALASTYEPLGAAFRYHLLLAEILEARGGGEAEADEERREAARQVGRLRENLDERERESFDRLPEVVKVVPKLAGAA